MSSVLTASHPPARVLSDCSADPARVFSRLAGMRGAIFLDSASNSEAGCLSLLAVEPEDELRGNLRDAGPLRDWLAGNAVENPAGVTYPLGGAFGYVTYEGNYHFGLYRNLLIYRHETRQWLEVGNAESWLEGGEVREEGPFLEPLRFEALSPRSAFEARVRAAQEYIAAGDIYQVNLAQRFVASWNQLARPWDFYRALREASPAPYAAYLNLAERVLMSSSPELFLRFDGPEVHTRPIKGTRPRFPGDEERDLRSAWDLVHSEKERAELIMITDLERNDLGQFCEFGSVRAAEVAKLEKYEQVFHLVSTVRGRMREEFDMVEALRLSFPGGSITGAPKRRAMEIIQELEGVPRGTYTGAIGYFGLNGQSQFSIPIRTAELRNSRLEFRVGAGIVADSRPEAEYEETLHKAAGMMRAGEIWGPVQERVALRRDLRRVSGKDGFHSPILRRTP